MVKSAPYRIAVSVVVSTLVLVGAGAAVTSSPATGSFRSVHQILGIVVGVLSAILALRLWPMHRKLAAGVIGFVLLLAVPVGETTLLRVLRACASQAFFALVYSALVITSPRWLQGPSIVQDGGFPSLRSMSVFAVGITSVQVVLGAAFRHGAMSIVPHVAGAMITTVVLLVLVTFAITQFPKHRALVGSSWHLLGVVTLQIGLGVVAFIGRLNHTEGAVPSGSLVASTVAHVVFGALTLASTVALALQIHYHVRPRAAFESGLLVAS